MGRVSSRWIVLPLVVFLASTSCSSYYVRKQQFPGDTNCTVSRTYPSLDIIAGVGAIGVAGFLTSVRVDTVDEAGMPRPQKDIENDEAGLVLLVATAAIGGLAGLVVGIQNTKRVQRCRDAIAARSVKRSPSATESSVTIAPPVSEETRHRLKGNSKSFNERHGREPRVSPRTSPPKTTETTPTPSSRPTKKRQLIGTGTCFAVDGNGHLVTNHHVIDGADFVGVFFERKEPYEARVVEVDAERDVAILKIERSATEFLPLASTREAGLGDDVFTIGFPEPQTLGWMPKYTNGSISATRSKFPWMMQISTPVQHGNSGGPLVNSQGEAIGITTGFIKDLQNTNFAVKADYAIPLLDDVPTRPKVTSKKEAIQRTEKSICLVATIKEAP